MKETIGLSLEKNNKETCFGSVLESSCPLGPLVLRLFLFYFLIQYVGVRDSNSRLSGMT